MSSNEVNNSKNERIMVCGATGFIGSHLVAQLLKQGYKDIHIVSRTMDSTDNLRNIVGLYGMDSRFEWLNIHYGSLTNFDWLVETMEFCHTVFNCAATVDFIANDHHSLIKKNVTLAFVVGEAAVKAGVKKMVHVSSIAALGSEDYPTFITEDTLMTTHKGQSPYAVSKFYSENEMWRISEKGLSVVVVNPAIVLGVGDWNKSTSPQIISVINKGIPFYPSGVMGYVMVEDVARAMILLSECKKAVGERFILCGGNLSYKEVIEAVATGLKRPAAKIPIANWLIKTAGWWLGIVNKLGIKTKFAKPLMYNLITKKCYDGTKVTRFIPEFKYCDIKEALIETGRAFRK